MKSAAMSLSLIPLALLSMTTSAEPIAIGFPDQTFEVLLQDFDPAFPPLVLTTARYQGGGVVEIGAAMDIPDQNGDPSCAFGLVEGSRWADSYWLDGPYCDPVVPTFGVGGLFGPIECSPCDWSDGFPSEVIWRSDIYGFYVRYRADTNANWTYGWIAVQAIVLENLTCNPDCEGWGADMPFVNFLAAGFDTEPGSPLPIGAGLCGADLNFDGVLDLADIQIFIDYFNDGRSLADRDANGVFDLADVQQFVADFVAGCS